MTRTYLVTGSAAGIGQATVEYLKAAGHKTIGVDIKDADIIADLSTAEGRAHMVAEAQKLSGGELHAAIAIAGLVAPTKTTAAVNYYGAIAAVEGLRDLLAKNENPRAVIVSSLAAITPVDDALLNAFVNGTEEEALAQAELGAQADATGNSPIYSTSKLAVAKWVRQNAGTPEYAGAGIALNAVAPGVILTAMTRPALETEEGRAAMSQGAPAPLNGPAAEPSAVASLIAWLTGAENVYTTGQIIFIDGGAESILRTDLV